MKLKLGKFQKKNMDVILGIIRYAKLIFDTKINPNLKTVVSWEGANDRNVLKYNMGISSQVFRVVEINFDIHMT